MLAARNFSVIYGGGRTGLMGAFARGAFNAAPVTGIIPHFLESEVGNGDIQKLLIVESMLSAKPPCIRILPDLLYCRAGLAR